MKKYGLYLPAYFSSCEDIVLTPIPAKLTTVTFTLLTCWFELRRKSKQQQ
jgi:hypothetical protein